MNQCGGAELGGVVGPGGFVGGREEGGDATAGNLTGQLSQCLSTPPTREMYVGVHIGYL